MTLTTLTNLLPQLTLPLTVANLPVGDLRLDSRLINSGDVFVSIGGNAFIDHAIASGAVAVLVDDATQIDGISDTNNALIIRVPQLSDLLGALATIKYNRGNEFPQIIGVTGTNGKSTLVSLVAQLLHKAARSNSLDNSTNQYSYSAANDEPKVATIGTLGVGILGEPLKETGMTTPDIFTIYKTLAEFKSRDVDVVCMEVSSHGLSQGRVIGLPIKTAVFTNLTQDHLDYHGDLAAYAQAKKKLFELPSVSTAIVNIDDANSQLMLNAKSFTRIVRYGIQQTCDVRAENIYTRQDGTTFSLISPWGKAEVVSPLYGVFNVYNVLAAFCSAMEHGASFFDVINKIRSITPIPGRMQKMLPVDGVQVVVDFAHTPDGLEQALIALKSHMVGRIWVVFGCGGNRDKQKRALMGAIAEDLADELVLTSDNPRNENPEAILSDIASGCKKAVRIIADRKEAINYAIEFATAGDCILIAGKGHEDYQIIKDQKIPFSDVGVANSALALRMQRSNATKSWGGAR